MLRCFALFQFSRFSSAKEIANTYHLCIKEHKFDPGGLMISTFLRWGNEQQAITNRGADLCLALC